ncbi:hypothetical protein KFU94_34510 [Chloroflexi bacterium TSY]|nr:hypothetical protein [Chloroflexi bacterium TSY]
MSNHKNKSKSKQNKRTTQNKHSRRKKERIAQKRQERTTDRHRRPLQKTKKQLKHNHNSTTPRTKQWLPRNMDLVGLDYDDPDLWDELLDVEEDDGNSDERLMPLDEQERRRALEQATVRADESKSNGNEIIAKNRQQEEAL